MKQKSIGSLFESAFPASIGNMSSNSTISPTTILETFVPGYGAIHKFFLYSFGFDVTVLVTIGTACWLSARIARSLWSIISSLLHDAYTSEISVSSTDEIHGHIIAFLANQYKTNSSRRLMAETPSKSAWELDSEGAEQMSLGVDEQGRIRWLNFSNQEAKTEPRFTPSMGSHNFWHDRTYFKLSRKEQTVFDDASGGGALKDKEVLTLSCFGRSTEPIKKLLQHAKAHYHQGHNVKTIIKRPAPKDMRRFGGRQSWLKIAERPCRPMKTVVLDEGRKFDVLSDINEYLNPVTARWYANRGIPYRRGYLFHGPPGTGKTSLTFALAGVFGLDIHVISLLEPTLTEEDLGMLFTTLPARCIVLLEDIDTAGLVREPVEEETGAAAAKGEAASNDLNVANLTKALKKANQQSEEEKKKGISLSGLLNIIDGVASHEGRVLVMTTNHPEKLDEALIRPGRVDHQVAFTNATQKQVKELFERMYTNDLPRIKLMVSSSSTPSSPASTITKTTTTTSAQLMPKLATISESPKPRSDILTPPQTPLPGKTHSPASPSDLENEKSEVRAEEELSDEALSDIAAEFAKKVPNDLFSPAEIQGFLLKRKKDPRRALGEVDKWVEGMLEQKRTGGRVLGVQ